LEIYILVILFFGITMYAANQVQIRAWEPIVVRIQWYSAIGLMFLMGVFPLMIVLGEPGITAAEPDVPLPSISLGAALATFVFSIVMGAISLGVVSSDGWRRMVQRVARDGTFDPESPVHITGVVLSSLLLTGVIMLFVISGGLEGLAESIETSGVNAADTAFTALLEVLAAGLSVGFAIRRDLPQTLVRLGLVIPSRCDLMVAVGSGVGLTLVAGVFSTVWQQLAPPDQLQDQIQAVEQITQALSNLPMALLISVAAAVGEEIFIRGALQPVFGIGLTSVFFALLHTQYLVTPSLLLIFLLSVVLGILRQRFNTTTALIAHFVYNFIPLLFIVLQLGTGVAAS
jgi:hypothetical protein